MTDKKPTKTAPPKTLTIDDVEIIKPKPGGTKVVVTVRCPITSMDQAAKAIQILSSVELKNYVYDVRHDLGLAQFGIEPTGSPRAYSAVNSVNGERVPSGDIKGYERDFRFTRQA